MTEDKPAVGGATTPPTIETKTTEGIAGKVTAAAVKGGPIASKHLAEKVAKRAAARLEAAKSDGSGVVAEAGTEKRPAVKPKKEKIRRDWKEIRAKWKAAKSAPLGTTSTTDAPAPAVSEATASSNQAEAK